MKNMDRKDWLNKRITAAREKQEDELDFFLEVLEHGYTLDELGEIAGCEFKQYAEQFMSEHGLI